MELKAPYLCLAARYGELRWCTTDERGKLLEQGLSAQKLGEFLRSRESHFESLGLAVSSDREKELKVLEALVATRIVRHCSWNDAALAGALSGRAGVWLSMDHWIPLTSGCHSSNQEVPDHGGQALALAREANHRTVGLVQAQASFDWLSRQALQLATPGGGLSGMGLQRVGRALGPLLELLPNPAQARAVVAKVQELADFPGPEPASLALLAKTARRLSDLMRHLCGRVRLTDSRAVWADGPLEGPLWNALAAEFQRYLPELRWSAPDHPPEVGVLLLLQGEQKERQRQALNPDQSAVPPLAEWAEFSQNAWRHLGRGNHHRGTEGTEIPLLS